VPDRKDFLTIERAHGFGFSDWLDVERWDEQVFGKLLREAIRDREK
jgi:hypothetical protein